MRRADGIYPDHCPGSYYPSRYGDTFQDITATQVLGLFGSILFLTHDITPYRLIV
jgi:hypothetical protein